MIKFIPVDPKQLVGQYIPLAKLLSFAGAEWQPKIFGVVGARDYGKTYGFKKILVKEAVFENRGFILLRDTLEACKKVVENNGQKIFGDLFATEKCLTKHNFSTQGMQLLIDKKIMGEVMPMASYAYYKGNFYNNCNILFDEFIAEQSQQYRGNRARQFLNMIETIARSRQNVRLFMTANALDIGCDILELLDIHIVNRQYGYYINTDKKVVIFYAPDSPGFIERRKNSLAAIIARGSFLDDNLNNNVFDGTDCKIFERRKPCSLVGIYHSLENVAIRLYKANNENLYYVCKDINSKTKEYMRFVFNVKQLSGGKRLATNDQRKFLENILSAGQVQFESKYLFGVYCSIINKTLKK